MKDLDQYLQEAIDNIRKDRAITSKLLIEVMNYLQQDDERHSYVGNIAAKYVETLQRSNEQLVKVASLIQKDKGASVGLTDEDRDAVFDIIKGDAS